jgi:hypothetical protein
LILSVGPLNYPLDDLVPLALLASDGSAVVNDVVQLHIVLTDYLQLSVHWVLLHFLRAVGLGKAEGRVEQGVHREGQGQMGAG